jgi:NAD(P)-dependent dehydrogenase (short-subunit alcohol dehydrogenase family)
VNSIKIKLMGNNMQDQTRFSLLGQVALVTGASSGIGAHFAKVLAKAGAKVAIAARSVAKLQELSTQIAKEGGFAFPVSMDVLDANSINAAVSTVVEALGPIEILVNCAGVGVRKSFLELEESEWDYVADTNLKGTWLVTKAVAPYLIQAQKPGSFINISSIAASRAINGRTAYATSKAGVEQLTHVLALELAQHKIRVNTIAPGLILTDMTREFIASTIGKEFLTRVPLNHVAEVEDLAGTLLLLASKASRYMTGACIRVDGGLTVNSI